MAPLENWILNAGALGTAAFGVVEAAKGTTALGTAGWSRLEPLLDAGAPALAAAYGPDSYRAILRATYRRGPEALGSALRRGFQIGLTRETAAQLEQALALSGLAAAVASLEPASADEPDAEQRRHREVLARYEIAVATRVDGAVADAFAAYASWLQFWAAVVAVIASFVVAVASFRDAEVDARSLGMALLMGLLAVPLAPLAKELVKLLQSATAAVRGRG